MTRVLFACLLVAAVQPAPRYRFDAAGRPARVDQSWELNSDGEAISVIGAVARCGNTLLLSDDQFTIYRADAAKRTQTLSRFAGEAQGVGRVVALTAECAQQRVYALNSGRRTITTHDLATGAVMATSRQYPRNVYEPRTLLRVSPDVFVIGGLWSQDDQRPIPQRAETAFWEETSIGLRLSLESGTISPGLPPYETRCIAAGACLTSDLDAIGERASRGWIASTGTSTTVARYDASGKQTGRIDVTSPKFVRDGTEVAMAIKGAETYERWRGRNSVIRRVLSFDRYLVVVHTKTIQGPGWVFGQQTKYDVFMNIYDGDGVPLTSDVRLPDLPVGRDATHLYSIDYGPQGRGESPDRVTLVRIPVEAGAAIIR
jgi:hypothetical protein